MMTIDTSDEATGCRIFLGFVYPDIQSEIDTYISRDHATFSVLLLMDFSEN